MPDSLDIYAEVTAANGTTYRWDANQAPGSRPQNLSFRTKIGEGFSDASLQLVRPIDQDYPDLGLGYAVTLFTGDGAILYEGMIAALPRDLSDRHIIGVTLTGWVARTKSQKMSEAYADRRTNWTDPPVARKAVLAGSISLGDFSWQTSPGGFALALPNQALGAQTLAEISLTMPPGTKAKTIMYNGTATSSPASWIIRLLASDNSDQSSGETYTLTLDGTLRTVPLTPARRYLAVQEYSNGSAATPGAGAGARIDKLGVYGDHTVSFRAGDPAEPYGVYASDVIGDIIARWCPELDASGVVPTSYVIQHLAFSRITPYEALLEINKYHLWHLGVWENRRLDFRPYDFTDYQWEIRTDDQGTTFSPQGPSTDSLFNGTDVTYTDVLSGQTETLFASENTELRDTTETNPWNRIGLNQFDDITLSTPTLAAQALELGRAALADRNRPRTPGTVTVRGYIRDRAGNKQPVSKIRAGETISITNFPNDTPRLIVETDFNDDDKTNRLAIDKPFALLDAYLDRLDNAVSASGRS